MEGKNLIQKFRGLHPRFVLERTLHPTFVDANRQPRFAFYKSSHRSSETVDLQLQEDGNNAIFKFDDESTHEIPIHLLMNSKLPGVQIPSFVVPNWIPINSHEWMLCKYEYDDLQNEDVQFDFLTSLYKYGMCVVEKFPDPMVNGAPFDLVKLLKTIVELRSTSWGDTFSVRSEPDGKKKDLAYTADAIPLHTDNPYRQLPPGYQWLYNVVNHTSGGINYFSDGYDVSQYLDHEAFQLLCEIPVRFENFDGSKDYASAVTPHFSVDYKGDIEIIRWSDKSGGYLLDPDINEVKKFYDAKWEFSHLLESKENQIEMRLPDKACVVIDNHRILHARTNFDASEGSRYVVGCYSDKDSHWSRFVYHNNRKS